METKVKRLVAADLNGAREMFALVAKVFEEKHEVLSNECLKHFFAAAIFGR